MAKPKVKNPYCEYCFDDVLTTYIENFQGAVFCDKKCMKLFDKEIRGK